mgnify:CR=1 FL=1|tara:strand:- start:6919 stop:9813 length:2895 start_codon:yes stop_codon:yes gene_type:complete
MANVIKGYPYVDLSITNPNVKSQDALDKFAPFSYLKFIQTVNETYQPDTLIAFYNDYVNKWNIKTNAKSTDEKDKVIERYSDFLQDITLNFTTNAEKTFLTQINFNNPYDVEIAMSFYSKKIRDIISYYKRKRDNLHYTTIKTRLKGSSLGVDQAATDLIIDFLENRSTAAIDYDINIIKKQLSVTLTEYFDNFANYFNRIPNSKEYGKHFKEFDPSEPPEANIFLSENPVLIRQVFRGVSNVVANLKEPNSLFDSKRKQTQKFIGTDFYFLSTDSNGAPNIDNNGKPQMLFKADKPYANFVNQNYPSTASVFSDDIISERDLGFFRPHNSSIVVIQGKRLEYFIKDSYDPNQLYIFPDPALYTNTQNILTFIVDTSRSINNRSKGIAVNQPNTDKDSTSFLGYNSQIPEKRNLNTDLAFLYDQGYIDDSKRDLFGNIFGLVKDYNYYRSNLELETPDKIKNLIFNGYQFFDDLYGEGHGFNYETTDTSTFTETIRSGLTSFTNGLNAAGVLSPELPLSTYNLFFRYFIPYQSLKQPSNYLEVDYGRPEDLKINADVKEGAYFVFNNTETLADPIRSGLTAYEASTDQFYFSDLIEGGIGYSNATPMGATIFRALCDNTSTWTRSLSGDFSFNVRLSGDNSVENYDGRYFFDNIVFEYTESAPNYTYRDEVYSPTSFSTVTTAADSFFSKPTNIGKIYVKNVGIDVNTPAVKELTDTLTYISGKYNTTICDELSTSVNNFDLFYDTLFIETSSFLVIEKTNYKNNKFISPQTFTNSLSINTNFFDKVSNRLRLENDVFYCKMTREQIDGQPYSNNLLYPQIYKYSYNDEVITKIFPTTTNPVISSALYFNLSTVNNVYTECSKPVLTYSSDNEQFNLAVLLKDQNKGPLLINYLFEYTNDINFLNSETFVNTTSKYTSDFVSSSGTIDVFTFIDALTAGVTNYPSIVIGTSALGPNLSAASLIL